MATKLNPSAAEFVPGSLTESWVSLPTEDEALEVSVLSRSCGSGRVRIPLLVPRREPSMTVCGL
jgi:hypothetical protein